LNSDYRARPGSPITNEQAAVVGAFVEQVQGTGLDATPAMLVDAARDPDSTLHTLFEWDDSKAAENWRRHWARTILGSLQHIEVKEQPPVKSLFNISTSAGRGYVSRKEVLVSPEANAQVQEALYRRLISVANEAESLGLARSGEWRTLCMMIRTNAPAVIRLRQPSEDAVAK
jgi:hypothetical protein